MTKKSRRVIEAEYLNYCEKKNPSEGNKLGFLSVMKRLADDDALKWIKEERVRVIEYQDEERQFNRRMKQIKRKKRRKRKWWQW